MTGEGDEGGQGADSGDVWPVTLRGVTESVVTTRGPNDRWNVAALGLHAGDPVTAKTYGRTRTWRNFRERATGYVQFIQDPVLYVDAALAIVERDDPVLAEADAWARVAVERRNETTAGGTQVVKWALWPEEAAVEREMVPTTNRGYNAVVEATVAVSRLDVDAYDRETLLDRLAYFETVVTACGGPAERRAFERIRELADADW